MDTMEMCPLQVVKNSDENEVVQLTMECENLSKALNYFELDDVRSVENEKVALIRFEIADLSCGLNTFELNNLNRIFFNKSIVLLFSSKNDEKFYIYWKSYEIAYFLTIKPYDSSTIGTNRKVFEFISKFLLNSLKNDNLGTRI